MTLKQKLQAAGIESSMLDELVVESACRIASRVNNEGMAEQLEYIEKAGLSEAEILLELGVE